VSSHQLQTIPIIWPFSTSGLDLVGTFKEAKGGFTHIFMAVDKFMKWIKVKHATSIRVAKALEFIKEIMSMSGMLNNIIADNGTRFTTREFKDFCADSGIKINYTAISHLQSNGQVKHSNIMILQGLKPESLMGSNPMPENGLKNGHKYCGPFVQPRVLLWATHRFLCFMDLRQCYLQKWSTNFFVCNISI
jgi:hypothetical protein